MENAAREAKNSIDKKERENEILKAENTTL